MSRRNKLSRALFDLAPMRPAGRRIFARRRRIQVPGQSTATKFFRNLEQLSALDGPLAGLTAGRRFRGLVAGCSEGCEAYSLAGHLALSRPNLDFIIDACDISEDALATAMAGRYGRQHGLGDTSNPRKRDLEARLFTRSGDIWEVADDIRSRVHFESADVLSPGFSRYRGYDCMFGQNFLIHMNDSDAAQAFAVRTSL
jgi:chemotaxis protein methyltransferase CheR